MLIALHRSLAAAPRTASRALPRLWLLTDERRLPDPLPAAAALPRGSGVILRHYGAADRERLGRALARLCRARGLVLLVAEDRKLARRIGADGVHLPQRAIGAACAPRPRRGWLVTAAAHDRAAIRAGRCADALFVSPVFPTESHPGARPLAPLRFAALSRHARPPVIALGGVRAATLPRLRGSGAYGVAAIGWLSPRTPMP